MAQYLREMSLTSFNLFLRSNITSNSTQAKNGSQFCPFSSCLRLPLVALWAVEWFIVPILLWTFILLLWRIYNDEAKDPSSHLPLPPGGYGIPLIGETLAFFRHRSTFFDERRRHYGNIFKTHLLGRPTVRLIGSTNLATMIRQEARLVEAGLPQSVRYLLGRNALSSLTSGESHTRCKRSLARAFTTEALQLYLPQSLEVIRQHLRHWCSQGEILVYPSCQLLTSSNAARIFLGLGGDADLEQPVTSSSGGGGGQFNLARWYQAQQSLADNTFSLPIRLPWGLSGLSRGMRARAHLLTEVDAALERVRRGENEECALAVLEKEAEGISDAELRDSSVELLFAGYETLSCAICSIVMEMGQRPEVIAKVQQELRDHNLLDGTESLDIFQLKSLPYVTGVVKECLRLQPPVGGVFRRAKQTFEINGYQIPAGWTVVYAIRDTHRQSPLFDPDFRPERWADLDKTATRFHYLPFSLGGHACLGREFAMIFLRAWVVELVRQTSWTLLSGQMPPEMDILPSPRPKDGLPARFVLRDTCSA